MGCPTPTSPPACSAPKPRRGTGGTEASMAGSGTFSTVGNAVGSNGQKVVLGPSPGTVFGVAGRSSDHQETNFGKQASAGPVSDLTKIVRDGTIAVSVPDGSF